ncbi:MAG: efflux RND transporter permease subunit, partial [Lachnospiraceae bacterium]|nr:efflux RND transporter permease subunit [Lachnospiraceae bacterium]
MSSFSVRKPYTVLVGVILAIVLGVVSFTKTTTDLLPNISLPYVIVVTTYPGASPETVESVITQPVEAGMATVSNIESIQSVSSENYSMVILEFAQSTNMDSISLEIREKLDQVKAYWDDSVGNPMIMKLNPNMLPIMIAAVGVDGMDTAQISTYVKDELIPSLESIEGVASASATGLLEKSVHVMIRQEKVDQVNEKIRAAIDKKMEDAAKELAEGRQKIEDSQKELLDGKQGILDGKKGLLDGQKQLEEGKQQLAEKQEETLAQLAATKSMLMSAKAQLEATKVTMTLAKGVLDPLVTQVTDLEKRQNELQIMREKALENLADSVNEGINGIVDRITGNTGSEEGEQGDNSEGSGQASGNPSEAQNSSDAQKTEEEMSKLEAQIRATLKEIREQILQNQYLKDAAANSSELKQVLDALEKTNPDEDPVTLLQAVKSALLTLQKTLNTTASTLESGLA